MSTSSTAARRTSRRFRLLGAFFAAAVVVAGFSATVLDSQSASAATVSFSQCNGHDQPYTTGAPLTVTCSISIVNTIDANGGGSSAAVYTRICTNDGCTGDLTSSSNAINAVHQCNNSDNVGGSVTTCHVDIVNNISNLIPGAPTAITLNQCIGSGGGGGTNMTACNPSSSGGATVTQCNGSGNGGGGQMTCTASGTTSDAFPVSVDQCNGSENGGGSVVVCDTSITTNFVDTTIDNVPPGGGTSGGLPGTTGATTDTPLFSVPQGPFGPPPVLAPPFGLTG